MPTAAAVALACLGTSSISWAQVSNIPKPDAGQVFREQAPVVPPTPSTADKNPLTLPRAPMQSGGASDTKILVKQVSVTGATLFTSEQLVDVVGDLVNREASLAELYEAANRITAHYQSKGYLLARAYLPPQEIKQGRVEIAVLEGRVGAVKTDNRSLVSDAQVQRTTALSAGDLVNEDAMERRLLILGDTPGVGEAYVTLQPGQQVGETALGITATPEPRVDGQLDVDNHGNRYTGRFRVGATVNVNSPLGWGDQLQVKALASDESLYNLRAQYKAPIGGSGLTVGVTGSWTDYDVGKEAESAGLDGWARSYGVFVSYPVVRSVLFNLLATANLEQRDLRDRAALQGTRADKSLGLGTLTFSGYGQSETVSYTFLGAYTSGRVGLRSFDADNADLNRRTRGAYDKVIGVSTGTWTLAPNWALYGSAYGQWAGKNLDSSERISLGGATGVRAYPQGEAAGDEGVIGTVELRYNWPLRPIQLFGFVDAGRVKFNVSNQLVAASPNTRELSGVGAGLTWAPKPAVALRGMVATRLTDSASIAEPDKRMRLWLQMLYRY